MQKFEIPFKLPGANEYITANRSNRYGASSMKKAVQNDIVRRIKGAKPKRVKRPSFFRFIWYEATRRRDKDNVAFAKKFIFDRLQSSGVLPNDNNDYVTGFADYFVYGKEQKVVVEIYDCDVCIYGFDFGCAGTCTYGIKEWLEMDVKSGLEWVMEVKNERN